MILYLRVALRDDRRCVSGEHMFAFVGQIGMIFTVGVKAQSPPSALNDGSLTSVNLRG
jgi:hypothetical protein